MPEPRRRSARRNLMEGLIRYDRINTTEARARAIRSEVEKLITVIAGKIGHVALLRHKCYGAASPSADSDAVAIGLIRYLIGHAVISWFGNLAGGWSIGQLGIVSREREWGLPLVVI